MSEYCLHINLRVTLGKKSHTTDLARSKSLSVNELVRIFIRLPASCADGRGLHTAEVIVRGSVPRLEREMRRWGNHCNQALHALNRFACYADCGEP